MTVIKTIADLRQKLTAARTSNTLIGFVPTMGFLHDGHLSLIQRASAENDLIVVSIFVNPLQFGPQEDFAAYPRDLERDNRLATAAGANIIFAPEPEEMYPQPVLAHIDIEKLGDYLCGQSRPGHFRGVCTVVAKLFNIIQPDKAYFGEKDAQQLAIIKRMVSDLNFPVEIVAVPTKREKDGLAKSSRNVYLSPEERQKATVLYRSLQKAKELFASGERSSLVIKKAMNDIIIRTPGAAADYIEITEPHTLQPIEIINDRALVALAIRIGKTRLIDNCTLGGVD